MIMSRLSIFSVMSNVQMLFFTMRKGELVGKDEYGNKYYRGKPRKGTKRERRWVIYKDKIDASLVPPEWHGWLHHQTDAIPNKDSPYRQKWQKKHVGNKTGTSEAYFPPSFSGKRDAAVGDYEAWSPRS